MADDRCPKCGADFDVQYGRYAGEKTRRYCCGTTVLHVLFCTEWRFVSLNQSRECRATETTTANARLAELTEALNKLHYAAWPFARGRRTVPTWEEENNLTNALHKAKAALEGGAE